MFGKNADYHLKLCVFKKTPPTCDLKKQFFIFLIGNF
jgi:hypothetical protein